MATMVKLQLGKKGLTQDFLDNIKLIFSNKDTESVRISVLKHSTRDKKELDEWAEKIVDILGEKFTFKTIGYTIVVRKWRKARAKD